MAKEIEVLKVEKRGERGTRACSRLREGGKIPAVVYGKGEDNLHVAVPLKEFLHLVEHGARMIKLDAGDDQADVLIKEIQHGTYDHQIMHADFVKVRADVAVTVNVEITLFGTAAGEAEGAVSEQQLYEMEVECLPGNIPDNIEVDITKLGVEEVIHVSEVPPVEGVKYLNDPEEVVVTCHMPMGEEEEEAGEGLEGEVPQSLEPEVIGREDEEEGEGQEKEE